MLNGIISTYVLATYHYAAVVELELKYLNRDVVNVQSLKLGVVLLTPPTFSH